MSNLDVDVRPVTGRIGAEITGVDLSSDLDDLAVEQIRTALLRAQRGRPRRAGRRVARDPVGR
jgi:alpha-ketoglutarate-dependent taurine dioxygenase